MPNFDKNCRFRVHLQTIRAEKTGKIGHFKFKNITLIHPDQLWNNFKKVPKMTFLTIKWSKQPSLKAKFLTKTVYFRGHIPFQAVNTARK